MVKIMRKEQLQKLIKRQKREYLSIHLLLEVKMVDLSPYQKEEDTKKIEKGIQL